MLFRSIAPLLVGLLLLSGCAESHDTCTSDCPDASGTDAGDVDGGPGVDGGVDGGDGCSSREPSVHRRAGATCDSERPTGDPAPPEMFGTCTSDADCTDGANGRCNGSRGGWHCTYDECFADADCDGASACECENGGLSAGANTCLPGNCRTDADCGTGFCSPTLGPCGTYDPAGSERANTSPAGYYCHTCEDECVDDSDCRDGDAGVFGAPYCAFDPVEARWLCADTHCVG